MIFLIVCFRVLYNSYKNYTNFHEEITRRLDVLKEKILCDTPKIQKIKCENLIQNINIYDMIVIFQYDNSIN